MPILLDGSYPPPVRVQAGDVLMVAKQLKDKETKKPFTWRFFAVVTDQRNQRVFKVIRLNDDMVNTVLRIGDEGVEVQFLPPEEWPDGVHAFRMRLILEGRIEDIV